MQPSPAQPDDTWSFTGAVGLIACAGLLLQLARFDLPPPRDSALTPPVLDACLLPGGSYWTGAVYGDTTLAFDWRDAELSCAGNARPGERGLRLYLAGRPGEGSERLLLIVGFDSGVADLAGREHPVSVTLIDEAGSHFFHATGERCFSRISAAEALPGGPLSWRVAGDLYCAGALPAVSGPGSVTLGEMAYAGRLDLGEP